MEFAVIKINHSGLHGMAYANAPRGQNAITGSVFAHETDVHPNHDEWERPVWFMNNYAQALHFATWIAQRNPTNSYIVVESKDMFMRSPGPLVHSKYSEAGLLPVAAP